MAILPDLPGISVSIESQGATLREYEDDSEWTKNDICIAPGRRSMKYIECISDTEFQIRFEILPPYRLDCPNICFWSTVDGQAVGGATTTSMHRGSWSHEMDESCSRISSTEALRQKFKFCVLSKVDDVDSTRVKNDAKLVAGLGEILVTAYRVRQEPEDGFAVSKLPRDTPTEIAEKALKGQALSHGIAFGARRLDQSFSKNRIIHLDGHKNPLGVFCFKYRSREALQQELIIPRSPSPDLVMPPIIPRRENAASVRRFKAERLAQLKREIEKIKAEDQEDIPGRKRSRGGSDALRTGVAYKIHRVENGIDVVDLTDD